MGKNAKIGIAAGIAVVLAVVLFVSGNPLIAAGVLVLGGLGAVALHQRMPDDDQGSTREKGGRDKGKGKGKSKLDQALEDRLGDAPRNRTAPPSAAPSGGGLPTWSPSGLDTWKPPADDDTDTDVDAPELDDRRLERNRRSKALRDEKVEPEVEVDEDDVEVDEPARETASASDWDSWDDDWDTDTLLDDDEDEDENPLAALDRLDEIDPIAEVERIESLAEEDRPGPKKSGFSFASAPAVINEEEVKTADDIMAASEAMELHVEEGGDSELAKLLAKVQARLSAYE